MKFFTKLSPQEKRLAYGVAAMLLSAILYVAVIEPLMTQAGQGKNRLQAKVSALRKHRQTLARYDALRAQYAQLTGSGPAAQTSEDPNELLKELEAMGTQSAVYISRIKPRSEEDDESSRAIQLDVSVRADAAALVRFLYRLETSVHLFRVVRFSVSPSSEGEGRLQCELLVAKPITSASSPYQNTSK